MDIFQSKPVRGFLLDVTGVLYNSSHDGGRVIQGSIEAVKRYNLAHENFQKWIFKIDQ